MDTRLIVLVGPTAAGKTETAIELAEQLGGEIVSADSRYLYRGMDIGTAKPTPSELARVRHHLVDVTTPDEPWSLAQYQAAAYGSIDDIRGRSKVPILVGGTGQYIRALVEGWIVPAGAPQGEVRAQLEQRLAEGGVETLAEELRRIDPESAARIDLRNPRRVIRALEVVLTTGESFAAQRRKQAPPFMASVLGLNRPRPELYARIDSRVDGMLAAGLVAEVEALVAKGYGWDLPAMSALGYRQIGQYLRGEASLEEAAQQIKRATRQFVRRQANWFKADDPEIRWFRAQSGATAEMVAHIRDLLTTSQKP